MLKWGEFKYVKKSCIKLPNFHLRQIEFHWMLQRHIFRSPIKIIDQERRSKIWSEGPVISVISALMGKKLYSFAEKWGGHGPRSPPPCSAAPVDRLSYLTLRANTLSMAIFPEGSIGFNHKLPSKSLELGLRSWYAIYQQITWDQWRSVGLALYCCYQHGNLTSVVIKAMQMGKGAYILEVILKITCIPHILFFSLCVCYFTSCNHTNLIDTFTDHKSQNIDIIKRM